MIRTRIRPETETITIKLPRDYVGKDVEVIAFAKNEGLEEHPLPRKKASFQALSIDTRGFKFSRDEANSR